MGAAYFIVLDSADPGFDTTVDGKALSRDSRRIDALATKLGFKCLDEYCSQSPEDARMMMVDLMGLEDENDLPPDAEETLANMPPEEWYDAGHGIDYAQGVADEIRKNPQEIKNADAVLDDLEAMLAVLVQAKESGLRWHLQVDF